MKIKVLGTRGEIEETLPYHSKHSGVLIDDRLLLDLGEKEFLDYKPQWIFLTHLHPDHAYFVRQGKEEVPQTNAPIYAPEYPEKATLKQTVQIIDRTMRFAGYTITPIPTHHSKNVKSQAYLVKKGKQSLLYSGDLIWINKEYHDRFDQVDLVITESSFFRKGGMVQKDKETQTIYGHNGIPNLIDLFKKHTKNILFIHFGSWFYLDSKEGSKKLIALAKEKGIHPIIGHDGLKIDLKELKDLQE
jgi:glyoxylase-like metal-dependent hydrolase (beta-lactamase superfamily II)